MHLGRRVRSVRPKQDGDPTSDGRAAAPTRLTIIDAMSGAADMTKHGRPPEQIRRTRRDWLVDSAVFLAAAAFGMLLTTQRQQVGPSVPQWWLELDQVIGVLACIALWWRRRWPVQLAVAVIVVSAVAEFVAGPMMVLIFTVAVHRPLRTTLAVGVASIVASEAYLLIRPGNDQPFLLASVLTVALCTGAIGWGLVVRNRRQLVTSLRAQASGAATEAWLRAEQAQHEARESLAREMHDVLGHRLSLLSVHAGALQYNREASPDEVARAAAVIRESAHQALQDLREILGVLRAPVGELPQPTLGDVDGLVAESRAAGMPVELTIDAALVDPTGAGAAVPATAGRTVYRTVQEALTNARKYAPGAAVTVSVAGAPGTALTAEIVNAAPAEPVLPSDGTGQGLLGLAGRAELTGGSLGYGPSPDGGWRVAVRLPWPA